MSASSRRIYHRSREAEARDYEAEGAEYAAPVRAAIVLYEIADQLERETDLARRAWLSDREFELGLAIDSGLDITEESALRILDRLGVDTWVSDATCGWRAVL